MTAGNYILAMTSVGDTQEGLERFVSALEEIDAACKESKRSIVSVVFHEPDCV